MTKEIYHQGWLIKSPPSNGFLRAVSHFKVIHFSRNFVYILCVASWESCTCFIYIPCCCCCCCGGCCAQFRLLPIETSECNAVVFHVHFFLFGSHFIRPSLSRVCVCVCVVRAFITIWPLVSCWPFFAVVLFFVLTSCWRKMENVRMFSREHWACIVYTIWCVRYWTRAICCACRKINNNRICPSVTISSSILNWCIIYMQISPKVFNLNLLSWNVRHSCYLRRRCASLKIENYYSLAVEPTPNMDNGKSSIQILSAVYASAPCS